VSAVYESADWRPDALKAALEAVGAERGLKLGTAQAPVRVAVTGRTVSSLLFESLEVLGRDRTGIRTVRPPGGGRTGGDGGGQEMRCQGLPAQP
jgi:glutamyl/glutaminyl-tRNA synthetase